MSAQPSSARSTGPNLQPQASALSRKSIKTVQSAFCAAVRLYARRLTRTAVICQTLGPSDLLDLIAPANLVSLPRQSTSLRS